MIECAVDEKSLAAVQFQHGDRLEKINRGIKVLVALEDRKTWNESSQSFTYPVIMSGKMPELQRIRELLWKGFRVAHIDVARRRPGTGLTWKQLKVYRWSAGRSNDEKAVVGICVPETAWEAIMANALNDETIASLPDVSWTASESRPTAYDSGQGKMPARVITITGPPDGVQQLCNNVTSIVFVPRGPVNKRNTQAGEEQSRRTKETLPANGSSTAEVQMVGMAASATFENKRRLDQMREPQPLATTDEKRLASAHSSPTTRTSDSAMPHYLPAKTTVEITATDVDSLRGALMQNGQLKSIIQKAGCGSKVFTTFTSDIKPFVVVIYSYEEHVENVQRTVESFVKEKATELKLANFEVKCRTEIKEASLEVERIQVRAAMRSLTYPVVVITSTSPGDESPETRHRGVAVSSFNTVTLSPRPIISFNLKTPSSSWEAIQKSTKMNIHLLAASPRGAAIAHPFTQPHEQLHGPFEDMRALGVRVNHNKSTAPSLVDGAEAGVLYMLKADLLPDKCIDVGDHVIVVASVEELAESFVSRLDGHSTAGKSLDDFAGLSYAGGAYRARGSDVKATYTPHHVVTDSQRRSVDAPASPGHLRLIQHYAPPVPDKPSQSRRVSTPNAGKTEPTNGQDPLAMRPSTVSNVKGGVKEVPLPKFEAEEPRPRKGEDFIYEALRAARDGKIEAEVGGSSAGRRSRVLLEEDDYNFGFERPTNRSDKRRYPPTSTQDEDVDVMEAFSNSERPSDEQAERQQSLDSQSSSQSNNPSTTNSTTSAARGFSTTQHRSMSTLALPLHFQGVKRFFTTTHNMQWKEMKRRKVIDNIVESSARQTTVADFFNLPEDANPEHPPRVRSLVRMKRQADRARRILNTVEHLPADQKVEFRNTIDNNERIIARKMAFNSAKELKVMLDKGLSRVDFTKARWMEESIERGQAILMDEALRLKRQRESGEVDAEVFAEEKAKLQELEEVLQTEIMRLRDVLEEADGVDDED
jgi:flavin reductase (DIM6/NTAB) family NADH-FMN oxidoreductase RutF